jgi:hypothetical protein
VLVASGGLVPERLLLEVEVGAPLTRLEQHGVNRFALRLAGPRRIPQRIERARAGQHLGILCRIGGRGTRRDPVFERFARGTIRIRRRHFHERAALALGVLLAQDGIERIHLRAQAGIRVLVEEAVERQPLFDTRQLADDLSAEADEEAREHERDDPHRDRKESFRHAQRIERHGSYLPPPAQGAAAEPAVPCPRIQTLSAGSRSGNRQPGSKVMRSMGRPPKARSAVNVRAPRNQTSTG